MQVPKKFKYQISKIKNTVQKLKIDFGNYFHRSQVALCDLMNYYALIL
jgi:hypothetical protein